MTDAYDAPPMLPVTPLPEEQFAQVWVYYVCTMLYYVCGAVCVAVRVAMCVAVCVASVGATGVLRVVSVLFCNAARLSPTPYPLHSSLPPIAAPAPFNPPQPPTINLLKVSPRMDDKLEREGEVCNLNPLRKSYTEY